MPNVKNPNDCGRMMNREVDFVAAIALPVEQQTDFGLKIFRFASERAAAWHFAKRPNCDDDPIEPTLSARETSVLLDVSCDRVEIS